MTHSIFLMTSSMINENKMSHLQPYVLCQRPFSYHQLSLMDLSTLYEQRNTDGTYDMIFQYLFDLNSLTLAGAEFERDFVPNQIDSIQGCNYLNCSQDSEFQTIIFGEILPDAAGTQINAKGNHFISNNVRSRYSNITFIHSQKL